MPQRQRLSVLLVVALIAALVILNGCAARKPQAFAMSFLPPTPLPEPDTHIEQPPPVTRSLYTSEVPNIEPRIEPEVFNRLKKAEERFEAGKKAYQAGEVAFARREFDRALDVLLSAPEGLAGRRQIEIKLDALVDSIYRYDLDQLGASEEKQAIVFDKSPLDSMLQMTFPIDPKLTPQVKGEIQATVSQLPLEQNDTVLSYIHFFSTERGRKTLIGGLRRSGRYRPLIQRILDEEGVPQELINLAQAESGFLPRAVSYKQATGMWQFMQACGREYGLFQRPGADDRLDPEKATRAAARHLRDLYAGFGDWYLAMAAYNCGNRCVDRAVQRTGYADFWELSSRSALPRQTLNYVPLILAITIMSKNPKDYGLEGIELERPLEYDTVSVKAATNLNLIADITNRPVSEIREMNPALLSAVAPAGYDLHLPKGSSNTVVAAVESIPLDRRASWRMHRVEAGETLAEIAARFRMSASLIAGVNNRTVEGPEAGDLLIIPAGVPQHASKRTTGTVTASRQRVARSTYSAPVSARVLHDRAVAHTVKTAGLYPNHGN